MTEVIIMQPVGRDLYEVVVPGDIKYETAGEVHNGFLGEGEIYRFEDVEHWARLGASVSLRVGANDIPNAFLPVPKYPLVEVLAGDGKRHFLPLRYVSSSYASGPDGNCIFCEGDPFAESDQAPDRIKEYRKAHPWDDTGCPICEGRH